MWVEILEKANLKAIYRKQVWGGIQLSKHQHLTSSELFFDILLVWSCCFRRDRLSTSPVSFLSSSRERLGYPQVSQIAPDTSAYTIELQLLK